MAKMYLEIVKWFILVGCLAGVVKCQAFDCSEFIKRTDVSRMEKIYRCLGAPSRQPKRIAHVVCPLLQPESPFLNVSNTSPEFRPHQQATTYKFQRSAAQSSVTGDIIATRSTARLSECSTSCIDDESCLSFAYSASTSTCITATSCNPPTSPLINMDVYNIAVWYDNK